MKPILIVDDEVAIAQLIAMTLARMGCTCQMAFDGLKAAELLEKNEYDLVLLDNKYIALYRDTLHERVWGLDAELDTLFPTLILGAILSKCA